jgi:hypothetical protein
VLQVHYASVDNIPPTGDDSGVFLQYTDEEQPKVKKNARFLRIRDYRTRLRWNKSVL